MNEKGAASTDYVDEDDLTPTEPDTPEPAPQVEEEYSQETAASKESFSYWVNYDPCTSSQKTEEPPEPEKLAKVVCGSNTQYPAKVADGIV